MSLYLLMEYKLNIKYDPKSPLTMAEYCAHQVIMPTIFSLSDSDGGVFKLSTDVSFWLSKGQFLSLVSKLESEYNTNLDSRSNGITVNDLLKVMAISKDVNLATKLIK